MIFHIEYNGRHKLNKLSEAVKRTRRFVPKPWAISREKAHEERFGIGAADLVPYQL